MHYHNPNSNNVEQGDVVHDAGQIDVGKRLTRQRHNKRLAAMRTNVGSGFPEPIGKVFHNSSNTNVQRQ